MKQLGRALPQVMHGMLEMFDDLPNTNTLLDDKAITAGWQAYKQVNRAFRDKVRAWGPGWGARPVWI